jgi:tetratricopeptide (TPR) repeat protein
MAGIFGVLLATNQPAALSNWMQQATVIATPVPSTNDPVEKEFSRIMELDDKAQDEADGWIQDNNKAKDQGLGRSETDLTMKIQKRFAEIQHAYEEFIKLHPSHARARIAFGSFLNDTGQEDAAKVQWIKATEVDPKNPAAWNNLANYYGHRGPITNAFLSFGKAIELNPREPVYYRNLATALFLFRQDAIQFFKLDEQQVFDRSLALYRQVQRMDPTNFIYATDLAETYYGIKPERHAEAMEAWQAALKLAHDDMERQGVYIHLARWEILARRFDRASNYLNQVGLPMFADLKKRVLRNLAERKTSPSATNITPAPPAVQALSP